VVLRRRERRQELTKIDWDDVYGFDYSCIKDIALREPLVDCVELRAVTTQPCAIRHIDIATVKKEDLTFKVPFELKATRNDCMSDFALWQCPTVTVWPLRTVWCTGMMFGRRGWGAHLKDHTEAWRQC
jgi:protein arginine N-methyltransferase 1